MPWLCVRGARGRSGGSGPVPVLASPLALLPAKASLAVRVAGCPARVSLPFACEYAIPCGLCIPRARSRCPLGPRHVSLACVCAPAAVAYATPLPQQVGVARALHAVPVQGAGRAVPGGSFPSAFPAPVLCSRAPLGGVARSFRPRAWLWVARSLVGGPVRPGQFGAWGMAGGRSVCCHPLGAWLGPGWSGGPRGRGGGGRSASALLSASLERAPRHVSSAWLSPWRVWSPYCSGSCLCAPVRARSRGRPCVPAGGWLAGWQAGWRRSLPRSL